jgi:hypothetical protein
MLLFVSLCVCGHVKDRGHDCKVIVTSNIGRSTTRENVVGNYFRLACGCVLILFCSIHDLCVVLL